jgi:hypothetical protein
MRAMPALFQLGNVLSHQFPALLGPGKAVE